MQTKEIATVNKESTSANRDESSSFKESLIKEDLVSDLMNEKFAKEAI